MFKLRVVRLEGLVDKTLSKQLELSCMIKEKCSKNVVMTEKFAMIRKDNCCGAFGLMKWPELFITYKK